MAQTIISPIERNVSVNSPLKKYSDGSLGLSYDSFSFELNSAARTLGLVRSMNRIFDDTDGWPGGKIDLLQVGNLMVCIITDCTPENFESVNIQPNPINGKDFYGMVWGSTNNLSTASRCLKVRLRGTKISLMEHPSDASNLVCHGFVIYYTDSSFGSVVS